MGQRWFGGVLLCAVLTVLPARGSILFSDGFGYADGPLVSVSEGRWKTHSGTAGQITVSSGSILLTQKHSEDVSAPFPDGPLGPIQALAVYAGFTATFTALPTGAGAYFAHFKDATATTGLRCRVFATTNQAAAGQFRLGISTAANTPTAMLPDDLNLGSAYRIVCRLGLDNNASTLWLNPQSELEGGVTSTDEATVKTAAAFAFRQSLASGAGMGELTLDDVVVCTTFAEALGVLPPESLRVAITQTPAASLRLCWAASPEQSYSVWATTSLAEAFSLMAADLTFPDGLGFFELTPEEATQFYQVSWP